MGASAFLDTNVLLYAISTAPEEAAKKRRARELLAQEDYTLSAQVLQEFYVNATRGPRPALSPSAAAEAVLELAQAPVVAIDLAVVSHAMEVQARYRVSYWDAAVIAAARISGATVLYSEDLSHGQEYDGVRVENPFLSGVREAAPGAAYRRKRM
jgi:predicted nucleic acid-binding protein